VADSVMGGAAVKGVGCTAGNTADGSMGCAVGCPLFSAMVFGGSLFSGSLFSGSGDWGGIGCCSDGKAVGRVTLGANVDGAGGDSGSGVVWLEAASMGAGCVLGASFEGG